MEKLGGSQFPGHAFRFRVVAPVTTITGICCVLEDIRSFRRTSIPEPAGILISSTIASGTSRNADIHACMASTATVTANPFAARQAENIWI